MSDALVLAACLEPTEQTDDRRQFVVVRTETSICGRRPRSVGLEERILATGLAWSGLVMLAKMHTGQSASACELDLQAWPDGKPLLPTRTLLQRLQHQ
jgi:hypothetical protein